MENAENTISEPLDFKIFWGRMPPYPPTSARFQAPAPHPPQLKIGSAVPELSSPQKSSGPSLKTIVY